MSNWQYRFKIMIEEEMESELAAHPDKRLKSCVFVESDSRAQIGITITHERGTYTTFELLQFDGPHDETTISFVRGSLSRHFERAYKRCLAVIGEQAHA